MSERGNSVDANPHLPNFFVVGAPKAGTTALYAYLDQHPQIYMCPLKEPNYFAAEMRMENIEPADRPRVERQLRALEEYLRGDMREKRFGGLVSSWEDYLKLFRNVANQVAIGEASACYLWSQTAPRNIAARIPHAKIVINLRNPVDRAFSQYLQMVTSGTVRRSFRDQIQASLNCRPLLGADWPLLEYGRYHEQLSRYLDAFPRSQLHISLYEDLTGDARALLAQLFAFLGVDAGFQADVSQRHHQPAIPRFAAAAAHHLRKRGLWPYLRRLAPNPLGPRLRSLLVRPRSSLQMEQTERRFLTDYYRDDIERLSKLLGRDLTGWLDCSAAAGGSRIVSSRNETLSRT
jgi:Sulfotransferase family